MHLDGPLTREVLARGCAIDLDPRVSPAGTCVQTLLAQTGVIVRVLADWAIDACTEYRTRQP